MRKKILEDIKILEPEVFKDNRGNFFESFNLKRFQAKTDTNFSFVQDNRSSSKKGVFRGLHYQFNSLQGKLVQVTKGEIFDVTVDLRKASKSYGNWMGINLSSDNKKQLWIPPGFAHGFLVLSDEADFFYKVTNYWEKADEKCIKWDDPELAIDFPIKPSLISEKDQSGYSFKEAPKFEYIVDNKLNALKSQV